MAININTKLTRDNRQLKQLALYYDDVYRRLVPATLWGDGKQLTSDGIYSEQTPRRRYVDNNLLLNVKGMGE